MISLHPVHLRQLPPSAKNCEGCDRFRWEYFYFGSSSRRRVCMWHDPPRIPGNLPVCPAVPVPEMQASEPEEASS